MLKGCLVSQQVLSKAPRVGAADRARGRGNWEEEGGMGGGIRVLGKEGVIERAGIKLEGS